MKKTVLVVDDSAPVRALLSELCSAAGAEHVESCANGFEAMRAASRAESLSLVITDVNMPDITGLELLRFLRENDRFRGVPLFVVSTDAEAADRERAMKLGANRYFAKPFDAGELSTAVREALGGK